jgi:hypothetical protein
VPAVEHLAVDAGRAAPVGQTGAVTLEFRDAGKKFRPKRGLFRRGLVAL